MTPNSQKCCKCSGSASSSIKLHRFPKATTSNILKATAWATYCWPEEDWSSLECLSTIFKKHKFICGRHFDDGCYVNSNRTRLTKHAVPGTRDYRIKLLDSLRSKISVASIVQQINSSQDHSVDECSKDSPSLTGEADECSKDSPSLTGEADECSKDSASLGEAETLSDVSATETSTLTINSSQDHSVDECSKDSASLTGEAETLPEVTDTEQFTLMCNEMAVAGPSLAKTKGPVVDPALCRCCRSIKKCRLLNGEYEWLGEKEVYSDMIMDCFGLLLSNLDGEPKDSGVCATCVVRLREAAAFRQQVLQSEQAFLNARMDKNEAPMVETKVKVEPIPDSDTSVGGDDDQDYGTVDPACKVEVELKPVPEKRKKKKSISIAVKKRPRTSRELFDRALALQDELDEILDNGPNQYDPSFWKDETFDGGQRQYDPRFWRDPPKKPQKKPTDNDFMIYHNTTTVVLHSYVCPFHNRISNYYCYYCRDQFTNPVELREHTLLHKPTLFESMTENRKIPKIDITRIDCRLCPEKIDTLEVFKEHISTVHNKKIYPVQNEFLKFKLTLDNLKCTECNNTFPYFDSLKKHMIEHFGTYICDQCGACFLEQNSLRTHIKSHSKVEANFPCEICGKNLKSKYSRYLHVATVHEKKATVNCYKCEDSFLSYALRNKHLIEVHGDKRTFPCKLCDKVYNRRKTLMEHNRRNHLKVYRHQCDLCEQRFYLPSRLKEHMATHTGERNYRCEYCDKCYPRLQSLQEHVRSHSSERRFKCDVCSAAFTQNGSLKSHMKSHHQGFELTNFG